MRVLAEEAFIGIMAFDTVEDAGSYDTWNRTRFSGPDWHDHRGTKMKTLHKQTIKGMLTYLDQLARGQST